MIISSVSNSYTATIFILLLLTSSSLLPYIVVTCTKAQQPPSKLLKLAQYYNNKHPHNTRYYQVLNVSYNATAREIDQQYKRLSRVYHPDKQARRNSSHHNVVVAKKKLEEVREAYECLKDDSRRVMYHVYGIESEKEMQQVSCWLNNNHISNSYSQDMLTLLRLMGFVSGLVTNDSDRIGLLASDLLERIRPLVEGSVPQADMVQVVAELCQTLKKLPLGSHILRCIGRSYRLIGRNFLRKYRQPYNHLLLGPVINKQMDLQDNIKHTLRGTKDMFTAALAAGRLVISEHQSKQRKIKIDRLVNDTKSMEGVAIDYFDLSSFADSPSEEQDEVLVDELIINGDGGGISELVKREEERSKAETAFINLLQIEALWKIKKIELDKVVREACTLIVEGDYFFYPSHDVGHRRRKVRPVEGWIGATGEIIETNVGRLRAAAAMVLIGETFIECSKDGTSWDGRKKLFNI